MKKLNFIGIGGATNIELGGNCCYIKDKDNSYNPIFKHVDTWGDFVDIQNYIEH